MSRIHGAVDMVARGKAKEAFSTCASVLVCGCGCGCVDTYGQYIKCCTLWRMKCYLASMELLEESLSHSQRQFLHCISVPLAGDMGSDQASCFRCKVV